MTTTPRQCPLCGRVIRDRRMADKAPNFRRHIAACERKQQKGGQK